MLGQPRPGAKSTATDFQRYRFDNQVVDPVRGGAVWQLVGLITSSAYPPNLVNPSLFPRFATRITIV
jgi:hypothetical protein